MQVAVVDVDDLEEADVLRIISPSRPSNDLQEKRWMKTSLTCSVGQVSRQGTCMISVAAAGRQVLTLSSIHLSATILVY